MVEPCFNHGLNDDEDSLQEFLDNAEGVSHPKHYNVGKIECIDYITDQAFNFNLGNVIKYVTRSKHKQNYMEDLKKALWYLEREINDEESRSI